MQADNKKRKLRPGQVVKTTTISQGTGKIMKKFAQDAASAVIGGEPVAWVMSAAVLEELIAAMDIVPVFTENYATLAAAYGCTEMLEAAEEDGFPLGICSYARTGIGHAILREERGSVDPNWPGGGMADPTVLLGATSVCEPRYKWYQSLRRYMDVPYFCAEVNMIKLDGGTNPSEVESIVVKTVAEELRRMKDFLVKHTGKRFDETIFMETVLQMERTKDAWWKCEEICSTIPTPMPYEDLVGAFPLGFMYCCYPESENFYNQLYAELQERVAKKMEVGDGEKYRILWGWGIPPYSYLKIFNILEEYGAIPVMGTSNSTFCKYTHEDFEQYEDPFERLAIGRFRNINHAVAQANELHITPDVADVLNFVKKYQCDGVVLNGTPSCRIRTIGQMAAIDMLKQLIDVPILIMENDMADPRTVNEVEIRSSIESFIEVVDTAKNKRKGN